MDRIEIDATLSRDRAWLLETVASLPAEQLARPATPSEHDPALWWSLADHFVHTALIEHNFNDMVRRFLDGEGNPVPMLRNDDGSERPREDIMRSVHNWTEEWASKHRGKTFSDLVAVTQNARGETLSLLSGLTDHQLTLTIPGAPWGDGTVGGVLAIHGFHGRAHYGWAKEGLQRQGQWLDPTARAEK